MHWITAGLLAIALVAGAPRAVAFCGFYVGGGGAELFNNATQVVLMRAGTRTVLSMQNNYQGPPADFAMVVPVPVVLQKDNVKTLPADVFTRVEGMSAPRLVEYWEQDPCAVEPPWDEMPMTSAMPTAEMADGAADDADYHVKVEARFEVGEYQIVILSASDSTGLDRWLRDQGYKIPKGAEPLLRPYVESGSKFFVAKVDPRKVTFAAGMATLSPLRFHYDAEELALPIRLGLANSSGTQDLIVNILAPGQRYEVANYPNVTIPTNLDVREEAKERFGEFYAALFDRTIAKNPGAVVTEYAWDASSCDPCPGPTLDWGDFATLGADVLGDGGDYYGFVLTRLHARYGKDDLRDDLVFRAAPPIVGGREFLQDDGKLEERARPSDTNNFQGRYAIRHAWTGPIACPSPRRGIWGGPPGGDEPQPIAATELAFAPRGKLQLPAVVAQDVPELGLVAGRMERLPGAGKPRACGCETGGAGGGAAGGLLAIGVLGVLRRRRQR
jgi:MYXO-CTERM domain-containing protein